MGRTFEEKRAAANTARNRCFFLKKHRQIKLISDGYEVTEVKVIKKGYHLISKISWKIINQKMII